MTNLINICIVLSIWSAVNCNNITEENTIQTSASSSSQSNENQQNYTNLMDDIPLPIYSSVGEDITKTASGSGRQLDIPCFPECDCHIQGHTHSLLCVPGQNVKDLYNPHNTPSNRDNTQMESTSGSLNQETHPSNQSTSTDIIHPVEYNTTDNNTIFSNNNNNDITKSPLYGEDSTTNEGVVLKPETEGDNPYSATFDEYGDYSIVPREERNNDELKNDNRDNNKTEIPQHTVIINKMFVRGFTGQSNTLWNFLQIFKTGVINKITLKNCMLNFSPNGELIEDNISYPTLNNVTKLEIEQGHWLGNGDVDELFFKKFPSLLSVKITNTDLSAIPYDILNSVQNLRNVHLSDNVLPHNESAIVTILSNMTELTIVNLSHNAIYAARIGCNNVLQDLNTLDLSNNAMNSLSNGFCSHGMPQLETLDFSGNLITALNEIGKFDGMQSLRVLYLHDNLITEMSRSVFGCSMSSLEHLSLLGNRLHGLDLHVLAPLASLTELNFSHNQIKFVKNYIHTQKYHSNNNSYNASFDCENLYYNNEVADNDYDDTKPFLTEINAWPQLETIDLSYNNISLITQSHFEKFFKNSKHLYLGHNRITYVPRYGIEQLHRLENIDLSHNDIDWMDVGTFTNPYLKDINLSHNRLNKIISMTFLYLPNLHRLDLSHNRLNYLYRLAVYKTCKYGQAMRLDLSHNKLSEDAIWKFMSTFDEMKSDNCLLLLHFQNNKMKYLLDDSSRLIFKKSLEEKHVEFIHMWTHTYFNMSHNPFRCDCKFYEDLDLIQNINHNVAVETQTDNGLFKWQYILCDKPLSLRGITFKDADLILKQTCTADIDKQVVQSDINCDTFEGVLEDMEGAPCRRVDNIPGTILIAVSVAFICTVIGVIVIVVILKKARVIPWLTHRAKWYRVYIQDNQNCTTVTIHYHKSDKSLATSELVYFVQDCCPSYDVILQPSDTISNLILDEDETLTNLFIISVDLMREIRGNREVQSHYETIIEQSQVSIFLIMGTRVDIEAFYPTFWAKIKYRANVYFVSGTDRLPKLQSVLRSTCNDESELLY